MKGKIDEDGVLSIQRGSEMKEQYCHNSDNYCSDSCPLFGEPNISKITILIICEDRYLQFNVFEDERI